MGEQILVVKDLVLQDYFEKKELKGDGFIVTNVPELLTWLDSNKHVETLDRDYLEGNPVYRQIIPYVMFPHDDKVFSAIRTTKGGESRLHHLRIIGFGGHCRPVFKSLTLNVVENIHREIEEELEVSSYVLSPFGIIYDNRTPVAKDHVGIVFMAMSSNGEVKISKDEQDVFSEAGFINTLEIDIKSCEPWSELILNFIQENPDYYYMGGTL